MSAPAKMMPLGRPSLFQHQPKPDSFIELGAASTSPSKNVGATLELIITTLLVSNRIYSSLSRHECSPGIESRSTSSLRIDKEHNPEERLCRCSFRQDQAVACSPSLVDIQIHRCVCLSTAAHQNRCQGLLTLSPAFRSMFLLSPARWVSLPNTFPRSSN